MVLDGSTLNRAILPTAEQAAAPALCDSEAGYRLLFESHPLAMWVFDRRTLRFLAVNEAAIRQYGFTEQEFLAMTIADIRPAEDVPALLDDVARRTHGLQVPGVWRHRRKDGQLIDVEIVCHCLQFRGIDAMFVSAHDVTEQKRAAELLEDSEQKYRVLFEESADAYWLTDEKRVLECNSAALQMFGYAAGEEMPQPSELSPPAQPDGTPSREAAVRWNDEARRDGRAQFEWLHRRRNGEIFPAEVSLTVLTLSGKRTMLGTIRDISDRKRAEEQVQFRAYYDALTGLPNRTLAMDRLEQALAIARRHGDRAGVLFLDLDRFKIHNDSLGHEFGDQLLQHVAQRLKSCAREQDTVARIGGDEFIIVLSSIRDMATAAAAAERFMKTLVRDFTIQGRAVNIGCSMGVSLFPEHGADGETLIKNADAAMYYAKEGGRNNFRFFTEEMHIQAMERSAIESNLRRALERQEFFLLYQPQMEIESGRITGVEALIRWQHPELGLLAPDRFISIAENSGLMLPIGEWVLRTACAHARQWQMDGLLAGPVAVNVSAVQFRQEGFVKLIRRVLSETGLPPEYLELELTEGLLLHNADVTSTVLQELKEMGLKLAIDDFGTGYSSLSYLRQFPVSKLKIDSSFVRDLSANPDDAVIIVAIISMAKSLKLRVIAEGVENDAQIAFLQDYGCDEIQGHYFSRPITAAEVAARLAHAPVPRKLPPMPVQAGYSPAGRGPFREATGTV